MSYKKLYIILPILWAVFPFTLEPHSGSGGCAFADDVAENDIIGLASGVVYQMIIASSTDPNDPGIPLYPLPPAKFLLSGYVCPGTGSAMLGFFKTIPETKEAQYTNYVGITSGGDLFASITPTFDYGISESYAQTVSPTEIRKWFRIYMRFDINTTNDAPVYVFLSNASPNTASYSVWFDGIQLEKAKTGQMRPSKYTPSKNLISPAPGEYLDGKNFYEW